MTPPKEKGWYKVKTKKSRYKVTAYWSGKFWYLLDMAGSVLANSDIESWERR